jgi:hypothetical protein
MSNEVLAARIGTTVGGIIALFGIVLAAMFENRRLRAEASRLA